MSSFELADCDAALVERVARGDSEAFAELYRRFARPVLGLAQRRLRDHGKAEDATQEAFAAVWRSARTFRRERGSASGWLYAVARNAIVDRARREPRVVQLEEGVDAEAGPDEHAELSWLAWRVHAALETLPERERTVLELAYWSGLSQSEIASYLDVPLGTVKTRTRTALARLADVLGEVR